MAIDKKTIRAAIKNKTKKPTAKNKEKDTSIKFASMKSMIDFVKEHEALTYKYVKTNMGLSDRDIYLRFKDNPDGWIQLGYEASKSGRGDY
jgi:hypothetical protein